METPKAPEVIRWITDTLPAALPPFLPGRRWFGGKGRAITRVAIEDAVSPVGDDGQTALVLARVDWPDGPADRYVLLLRITDDPGTLPVIARFPHSTSPAAVVEAATDADTARKLIQCLGPTAAVTTLNGGRLVAGDVTAAVRATLLDPHIPVTALGSEQSNTSLRVGARFLLKLIRRLDSGENPELEIGRFLTTRTTFQAFSALRGSLSYEAPDGASHTVAVLQDWVDNQGDGWTYVIAGLNAYLATGSRGTLTEDLAQLGVITAEFHAAMASSAGVPAFEPEPVTAADIAGWRAHRFARASRCLSMVQAQRHDAPPALRSLIDAFLPECDRIAAATAATATSEAAGAFYLVRVHGDYHLGQTLKTAGGFTLVDFEGEPSRPIAERRRKTCALRDVAGMLRSIDYAIETAAGGSSTAAETLRSTLRLRESFLESYLASAPARHAAFLPASDAERRAWIAFFEIDKALYEIEYEILHRPTWMHIPLRGILTASRP